MSTLLGIWPPLTLDSNKVVNLKYLDPDDITKKTIMVGYPLEFPLDTIEQLPYVAC